MCGRFTLHSDPANILDRFEVAESLFSLSSRYNIAPQQTIPVILAPVGNRVLDGFRWGLVPSWAKDSAIGQKMINARSETLTEKPSFRTALVRRRCLIPADGFYEWERRSDNSRHPIHFRLKSEEPFGFAGLYDEWHDPQSDTILRTCTLITTQANAVVANIHDRMPVILAQDAEAIWLDPTVRDSDLLRSFLKPYPEPEMVAVPVSQRVNSPMHDSPDLLN